MTLQIEAGSDVSPATPVTGPRPCTRCDGTGSVEVLPRNAKPWDSNDVECPRCEGSLVEPCDHCGEPSVDRYLGDDLCAACLPSEEERFDSCSICERPIDARESALPLCQRCEGTARVAGQQAADARRYPDPDRERVA